MNYDMVSKVYKYLSCPEWIKFAMTNKYYYEIWLKYTNNFKYIITRYYCEIDFNSGDETPFYAYKTEIIGIYDKMSKAVVQFLKIGLKDRYAFDFNIREQGIIGKCQMVKYDKDDTDFVDYGLMTIHFVCVGK